MQILNIGNRNQKLQTLGGGLVCWNDGKDFSYPGI